MEIKGLAFLPILWVSWTLLGLVALFSLTVIQGHSTLPFISDTGIQPPESEVYTIIFMVSAILGAGIVIIQYKFMVLRSEPAEKKYVIGQRILLIMGWIICIGTAVNAVYSMKSNPTAHRIGAGLAFALNAIYNVSQSAFLYKRTYSSRLMCHFRLAKSILVIMILLIFAVGSGGYFFRICTGHCLDIFVKTAMVTEWISIFGLTSHQLTNFTDYQHLSLTLSRTGVSISLWEAKYPENS